VSRQDPATASRGSDAWGLGRYEDVAGELEPAAEAAVDALGLEPGMRVLDVACGSGNAAALAAGAGAHVFGLDTSPRLIDVARERIPDGEFIVADATAIPFEDDRFDAAVSVFGVIFASPAAQAASELARVVRPGGRVAITSWPERGPAYEMVLLMRQAIARVRPPQGSPPVNWGDPAVLRQMLGEYGELEVDERELDYDTSLSPQQIWERLERVHPMWIGARELLVPAGEWDQLREASIAVMSQAAREGVRTSPYLLATLTLTRG
jgi:SAM-dependent methyltransferase